jgi:CheY-like chemotaxis protein
MNIAITSHIATDCGLVSADPTQVHQIMMNLITNAYHAVEGSCGTIHVALKAAAGGWNSRVTPPAFGENDPSLVQEMPGDLLADRYACISISDTGIGMDQALIDKIFDPYFTTKEQGKGTGLGLSVVHGIIKEHGGDIRVYSEPGKGTAFHVYLPLLEDAKDGKAAAVARKHPTGSESILLVDDEEPIVRMVQMMLERLGYRVTARMSSPEALAVFKADPGNFDLVISDRGMPNLTGEQLAVELISIRPGIPIILCTGFSDEADVQRASAMGIEGFLMKPVATGDLAEMVRKVLDDAKARSALSPIRPAADINLEDD